MKFGSRKAGDGQATGQTAQGASPKTALCNQSLTEKRSLVGPRLAECAFP